MKMVNQIDDKGEIINDFDVSLTKNEVFQVLKKYIKDLKKVKSMYYFEEDGNEYCIYIKNITYLGNPHPIYKKRIQIGTNIQEIYESNTKLGIKTLILGVYGYNEERIFCDFKVEDYILKKTHNSSAHVNVFDLKRGKQEGHFMRTDFFGNHIHVFSESKFQEYLTQLNFTSRTKIQDTISIIEDFMYGIKKEWLGIQVYDEMFKHDFADKRQSEWAGFFLEYLLQEYLYQHQTARAYIEYRKSKKNDDIDLDLYFPKLNFFGDLKAHSDSSNAILGNDQEVVEQAITKHKKIWYIICEHKTEKDSDYDYEVTKHWNNLLAKEDLTSYGDKMKYSVILKKFYILEINKDNYDYLTAFNQGTNSNGKPRKAKIMISKKNIDMFLLHTSIFE